MTIFNVVLFSENILVIYSKLKTIKLSLIFAVIVGSINYLFIINYSVLLGLGGTKTFLSLKTRDTRRVKCREEAGKREDLDCWETVHVGGLGEWWVVWNKPYPRSCVICAILIWIIKYDTFLILPWEVLQISLSKPTFQSTTNMLRILLIAGFCLLLKQGQLDIKCCYVSLLKIIFPVEAFTCCMGFDSCSQTCETSNRCTKISRPG